MSMGPHIMDSPVHGWGGGCKAPPGVSSLGKRSPNTSWSSATGHWCSATSTLWSRSLFRTAREQPAGDSTTGMDSSRAPARAFPSQRNRLLAFGSLEALAHRELGMESSIRTLNPCILLYLSLPDCVCSRVGIIHSRPQPLYFTVLEFLRVGLQ